MGNPGMAPKKERMNDNAARQLLVWPGSEANELVGASEG